LLSRAIAGDEAAAVGAGGDDDAIDFNG